MALEYISKALEFESHVILTLHLEPKNLSAAVNIIRYKHKIYINHQLRAHSISPYTKFSEKLTYLSPLYTHVRKRITGKEVLIFRKSLHTY